MRTTRASAAIEKLKLRSNSINYSMAIAGNGLISLVMHVNGAPSQRLSEPMQLNEFVAFVNAYGPQTPKRVSKLDIAFSKQLTKKPE